VSTLIKIHEFVANKYLINCQFFQFDLAAAAICGPIAPKTHAFCLRLRRCCRYDSRVNKTALAEAQAWAMVVGDDELLHKM
jgi:hypothetical protein